MCKFLIILVFAFSAYSQEKIQVISCTKDKLELTQSFQELVNKQEFFILNNHNLEDKNFKVLVFTYKYNNLIFTKKLQDKESVLLPEIPKEGLVSKSYSQEFKITQALVGAGLSWIDITEEIKEQIKTPFRLVKIKTRTDPAPYHIKTLGIIFEINNRRFFKLTYTDTIQLLPSK